MFKTTHSVNDASYKVSTIKHAWDVYLKCIFIKRILQHYIYTFKGNVMKVSLPLELLDFTHVSRAVLYI